MAGCPPGSHRGEDTAGTPSTESPAVARRRVRLAIRAAREAKGLTQTDVANAMEWSLSKVMRIEKGEVNVGQSDLKLLLALLGIGDEAGAQRLLADARLARQERWTVDPHDRQLLTPAMIELVQFESAATTIRLYQNLVVPGILQTRAYAEAIFDLYRGQMDPAVATARIESRLSRQHEVLYRDPPANVFVVLEESVLQRQLGNPRVMKEQLGRLTELVAENRIHLRILPFLAGIPAMAFLGSFSLYSLEEDQSAFAYREVDLEDLGIRTDPELERLRISYERMWTLALTEPVTVDLIKKWAADLR